MAECEYELWDKKTKQLQKCGYEGKTIFLPDLKITKGRVTNWDGSNRCSVCLCEEHKKFVSDCLMTEYYIKHKKHINKQKELFKK